MRYLRLDSRTNRDLPARDPAAARSERIVIRVPDGEPAAWLLACAAALSELPATDVVAWLGRRRPRRPPPGAAWIDETATGLADRLHAAAASLILDFSELPLPPGLAGVRRWLPVYGAAAQSRFRFADALLGHRRAVLVRLVEVAGEDTGTVLEEGRLRPVPHAPAATHARLRSVVAGWPARILARRHAGGAGPTARIALAPAAGAAHPVRQLGAVVRTLAARLDAFALAETWAIGVVERPIAELLAGLGDEAVRWLPAPKGGDLADPFARAGPERLEIVAELARGPGLPGLIVACSEAGEPRPVLPSQGHASYPFLIEDQGEVFMLPELSASGRTQLFRALSFPDRWVADAVLLDDVAGVDPTVVKYRDMWWLFTGDLRDQADARLHLFMAERLRGPWRRHPRSPVKDDLASARPAGTPFVLDGRLFRPGQDCSRHYGEAVVIHRVDVLTPEAYGETAVIRIGADPAGPYPHGLHTIAAAGKRTLIDGKRQRRSLRALLRAGAGALIRRRPA
jgi:hypothetical protein